MTKQTNIKRGQQEAETMANEPTLAHKIGQAKLRLNTLLLTGESTTAARAALKSLTDEQKALDAAAAEQDANQHAARQSLAQIEADRIANDAVQLAAARANRISMISQRYTGSI